MRRILPLTVTLVISLVSSVPVFAQIDPEQTPIDITRANTVRDTNAPVIAFSYGVVNLQLTNTFGAKDETGRVIAEEWATLKATPQGVTPFITVDGVRYELLQFHFHTPSEHAVNGRRADMEVHFVHLSAQGCSTGRPIVVLGALIEQGGANRELQKLFPVGLPTHSGTAVNVSNLDLDALLPKGQPTWRYEGSLTAPSNACPSFAPLSTQLVTGEFPEAVHWFLYGESLQLPKRLIDRFQDLFPEGNSRNLKLVGDRDIYERRRGR